MDSKWKFLNPLIIILLLTILVIVLTKDPVISVDTYPTSSSNHVSISGGIEVVNLGNNRIVLFSTDVNSRNYGDITVLEFDEETNSLKEVSEHNLFLDEFFR